MNDMPGTVFILCGAVALLALSALILVFMYFILTGGAPCLSRS